MGGLRIRIVVMDGGERFPVLLAADGVPLFRPTVWSVAMRRAVSVASATILSDLIALKLLYSWAEGEGIALEERMLGGRYLSPGELNSLARMTRYRLDEGADTSQPTGRRSRPVSLEHHRQRSPAPAMEVDLSPATDLSSATNPSSQPNADISSDAHLAHVRFAGRCAGLIVFYKRLLSAPLPPVFFKLLVKRRPELQDLKAVDVELYRSLCWVL